MTLNDWAAVSTIVQAVLVVISLVFIWYQLQVGSKLAKAANSQALTEQAAAFNSLLIQNRELATLWYSYGRDFDRLDLPDRLRYREMLVQWLIFHSNIYYQWKKGLLDKDIYTPWLDDLKETVNYHQVDIVSSRMEEYFPGEFGQHLTRLKQSK